MDTVFQHGTPEEVGISSEDIRALIKQLKDDGLYMHSLLVIRQGKLVAEGYYAPFTRETKHRMYSISKSFTSGAIGLLVDEGKVKLTDRVHTFFPEFPEENLHPYVREATVRDLLMMASPHETTYSMTPGDEHFADWVGSFFTKKPNRPAGTVFRYDTSASFILNVIVERVTGKPYLEYLQDKMLRKMGCSEDMWCVQSPDGYSWGGSGVICTPLDLAKFAFVFLRGGKVNGEQLLSEAYVKAATSRQIVNNNYAFNRIFENYGYGYQIWCVPENGFLFNGMGCQFVYAVPEKDLLIVCTADNQGRGEAGDQILSAFVNHIIRKTSKEALPEDKEAYKALQDDLAGLSLNMPKGEAHSALEQKINGVIYKLDDNRMGLKWICFTFEGDEGVYTYENTRGVKKICFGLGKYASIKFPETHYSGYRIGTPKNEGYNCQSVGVWTAENQLLLRVNVVDDYFGSMNVSFGFRENFVGLTMASAAEAFLQDYNGVTGGMAIS